MMDPSSQISPRFVAAVITPLLIRGAQVYAQTAKARSRNGNKVFTSPVILGVSFFGFVLSSWLAAVGVYSSSSILFVAGLAGLGLSLSMWPTVIILEKDGITARHLWRRTRTIPYKQIEAVSRTSDRTVTVYAKGELPDIEIDNYHIAADELESELKQRGVAYYDAGSEYLQPI